jgi:helix-turn-helix protein
MDFNDVHNKKQSYKGYYKPKFEDEISYKDFHNNLNKQLCENQIKIKRCIMRGFKDYKIKSILGITNYEYEKLKEKLKENILTYGLYSANI